MNSESSQSLSRAGEEVGRLRLTLSLAPIKSAMDTTLASAMTGAAAPTVTQKDSWKDTEAVWHSHTQPGGQPPKDVSKVLSKWLAARAFGGALGVALRRVTLHSAICFGPFLLGGALLRCSLVASSTGWRRNGTGSGPPGLTSPPLGDPGHTAARSCTPVAHRRQCRTDYRSRLDNDHDMWVISAYNWSVHSPPRRKPQPGGAWKREHSGEADMSALCRAAVHMKWEGESLEIIG